MEKLVYELEKVRKTLWWIALWLALIFFIK